MNHIIANGTKMVVYDEDDQHIPADAKVGGFNVTDVAGRTIRARAYKVEKVAGPTRAYRIVRDEAGNIRLFKYGSEPVHEDGHAGLKAFNLFPDAPPSATPTTKSAEAPKEKPMSMFENIVTGGEPVQKNARHFDASGKLVAAVNPEVDRFLDEVAGTAVDATRAGVYPANSFLRADNRPDEVEPGAAGARPYATGGPTAPRDLGGFLEPNVADPTADPAMYSPSQPGAIRLGNTVQFTAKRAEKAKPSFASVVFGNGEKA